MTLPRRTNHSRQRIEGHEVPAQLNLVDVLVAAGSGFGAPAAVRPRLSPADLPLAPEPGAVAEAGIVRRGVVRRHLAEPKGLAGHRGLAHLTRAC